MQAKCEMLIQSRLVDRLTGKIVKENKPRKNLIMDSGLNCFAGNSFGTMAGSFERCVIGDGTTPTSYASGAITFTQAGTTITASAGFFTALMVGMLFKYGTGTGGAEYYITGYTDSTHVTVGTSATVGTPTVATVWAVNQNALANQLYSSTTYSTGGGDCGTTYAHPTITFKRTFNFAHQGTSYNVNEIGWTTSSGAIFGGRIVLGSTDVVSTLFFYQVVMTLQVTFSPATPSAVSNVGTNIDVSGNAMVESFDVYYVTSTGTTAIISANGLDVRAINVNCSWISANYSQGANIQDGLSLGPSVTQLGTAQAQWSYPGTTRGLQTLTINYSAGTTGETLYGVAIMSGTTGKASFDVKFTTPQTAPTGTFSGTIVWNVLFDRNLSN